MAGNKVNTKSKVKDDRSKLNKNMGQQEEGEEIDFSMLRKPILTSVTGFGQARRIFDLATQELKDLLSNECDLLYECKVCRSIFRSLANFISHKRMFCKEKFNPSNHGHFATETSLIKELRHIKHTEDGYQESLKEKPPSNDEDDEPIPMSKDLTSIIERMTRKKGIHRDVGERLQQLSLHKIPSSSVAVFQTTQLEDDQSNNMRSQVEELDHLLSQDQATLQQDGRFNIESSKPSSRDGESVIQISDDDDSADTQLKCNTCQLKFSTQKTLKFHMKYKHMESRLVYPCPACLDVFSTSWSVFRHLFKVHRKTAAQIRRLREWIHTKAFRMDNPPTFYEKKRNNMKLSFAPPLKISDEERLDQENQAWMENMESDGCAPRCGGCGRTFPRRAALVAHTAVCQPRNRALRNREQRRIEIQIRKDYNKGPSANDKEKTEFKMEEDNDVDVVDKEVIEKDEDSMEPKLNQDETSQSSVKSDTGKRPLEEATMFIYDEEVSNDKASNTTESPEKNEENPEPEEKTTVEKPKTKVMFSVQAEKLGSNLKMLKQKMISKSDVDIESNLCKKCNSKCQSLQELCDHMAAHYKWMRYACKLCNYKNYYFEKLAEHVKTVHKMKGDNDFYYSTVKAIDGTEALEIFEANEEGNEDETSPDSRRPSRCSSDSSRLSDDSSSSVRIEGSRKRKMNLAKTVNKRKKEASEKGEEMKNCELTMDKVIQVIFGDSEAAGNKSFDENSSEWEDVDEKVSRKPSTDKGFTQTVASRRPVRNRAKRKNEDFEYDLSNLLKMEAQGYREAQNQMNQVSNNPDKTKLKQSSQNKRKSQPDTASISSNDSLKEFSGALLTMSKKSLAVAAAHIKPYDMSIFNTKEQRNSTSFLRPLLPKPQNRTDKNSPKKVVTEVDKSASTEDKDKPVLADDKDKSVSADDKDKSVSADDNVKSISADDKDKSVSADDKDKSVSADDIHSKATDVLESRPTIAASSIEQKDFEKSIDKTVMMIKKNDKEFVPKMVPINIRRQSIDIIKNPIINKNLTDLSKAGMKTKILVIKPINRNQLNKDGSKGINSSLKIQRIKLKDTNSSVVKKKSDQVMVVKVPAVGSATAVSNTNPEQNNINIATDKTETSNKQENHTNDTSHKNDNKCNEIKTITENSAAINNNDTNVETANDNKHPDDKMEVDEKL